MAIRTSLVIALLVFASSCVRGFSKLPAPDRCAEGASSVCSCDDGRSGKSLCAGGLVTACDCRTLQVRPATIALSTDAAFAFTVDASADAGPLTWSVVGSGTVDANGVFTAASTPGSTRVVASTSDARLSSSAEVTVVAAATSPVMVAPDAVSTGDRFTLSIAEPLVGSTYSWTALNASFESAPVGTMITLRAGVVGQAFVSVQVVNTAGDAALPVGKAIAVVPTVSASEQPAIIAPTQVAAGRNGLVARVQKPVEGLDYAWVVTGASGPVLPSGPSVVFSSGAVAQSISVQVTALNAAGSQSQPSVQTIAVVAPGLVDVFSGQPSAEAGSLDGADGRLLPALALRKVGANWVWLQQPFADLLDPRNQTRVHVAVRSIDAEGRVSTLASGSLAWSQKERLARGSLFEDGAAIVAPRAEGTLWYLPPGGPVSLLPGALPVSEMYPLTKDGIAAASGSLFAAQAFFNLAPSAQVARLTEGGSPQGVFVNPPLGGTGPAGLQDSDCNDVSGPTLLRPESIAAASDSLAWFVDNRQVVRSLDFSSPSPTLTHWCGKCSVSRFLPSEALAYGGTHLFFGASTSVSRLDIVTPPASSNVCDVADIVGSQEAGVADGPAASAQFSAISALAADGNTLGVADGARLREVVSAVTGTPVVQTLRGQPLPVGGHDGMSPVFETITAVAYDSLRAALWVAERRVSGGNDRCALSRVSSNGAAQLVAESDCVARPSLLVSVSLGDIMAMAVAGDGSLYLVESGGMSGSDVLRRFDAENSTTQLLSTLSGQLDGGSYALSVDSRGAVHLVVNSAGDRYFVRAAGAVEFERVTLPSSGGPVGNSRIAQLIVDEARFRSIVVGDRLIIVYDFFTGATATFGGGTVLGDTSCDNTVFYALSAAALDARGDLWVVDSNNDVQFPTAELRHLSTGSGSCLITRVLGRADYVGAAAGPAATASLGHIVGAAFDIGGDLLLADQFERAIYRYRP